MKKNILLLTLFCGSYSLQATIHTINVWDGYFQFLPNTLSIQPGDTIQWLPLDQPSMVHTITSDSIPAGALPFDQIWQAPADTFFQYVPLVAGLYKYVCTPHISLGMIGQFMVTDSLSSTEYSRPVIEPRTVFPNPAVDVLTIKDLKEQVDFKIINSEGKIMFNGVTVKGEIEVLSLTPGIYYLELLGDRREIVRFVKQ